MRLHYVILTALCALARPATAAERLVLAIDAYPGTLSPEGEAELQKVGGISERLPTRIISCDSAGCVEETLESDYVRVVHVLGGNPCVVSWTGKEWRAVDGACDATTAADLSWLPDRRGWVAAVVADGRRIGFACGPSPDRWGHLPGDLTWRIERTEGVAEGALSSFPKCHGGYGYYATPRRLDDGAFVIVDRYSRRDGALFTGEEVRHVKRFRHPIAVWFATERALWGPGRTGPVWPRRLRPAWMAALPTEDLRLGIAGSEAGLLVLQLVEPGKTVGLKGPPLFEWGYRWIPRNRPDAQVLIKSGGMLSLALRSE